MRMMSVAVIVLEVDDAHHMDDVLLFLQGADINVEEVDRDNGVIYVTGESKTVYALERYHLVAYVRVTFQYVENL